MGFTLAWVVVAVVGLVVLQLGSVVCSGENKLKLEVVRHCVPESAQLSRTHVFYRGCTIELLCYYKPCSKETPSDLVVSRMYDGEITNMEERTRTNCTLMVKLRNMTDSAAGVYTCRDNYNRLNPAKPLEFKAPHLQVKVKEMCLHHQHTLNEKPTVLYYYVGCSIRLMCRYVPCLDTTHTNLTITTMRGENQTRRPVEWSRSKCSVEVEFGNMTAAFAGAYRCQDTVSQLQATPIILKPTRWEFTIEEPCILDPERVRRSRDVHYFYAGCSIKLLCRYNPCLDNITSNLEVYFTGTRHDTPTSSIVLTKRTNCLLEVELRNMTDKFAGDYVCQDTISHHKPPPLTLKVSHCEYT
ncbi:hypothetical protein BaRGS_00023494 [Batillaria attramentaria]|uniref:Ig-like domain-containing protein n=1 Tax=Batillaria attramentaria TaxID=370345 RepID=A0ABD0KDK1_9CAEN